ncbi:M56 family metallopeptidase [Paenibacillus qinlingensis]|uniref:Beta-lactamase regulating signal transducer with metallopeptidase domain n=1 Tax=Paenibacillus qinlingensis TaxID=1837343 RepID=A0ABU1NZR4_9BACL|nr:M56 family metallopeptidase [Paenibacillus qinlingensis]MDR6552576.1 beta-lactamase regulating signal transducer with metallopeptidase domain [Paenibacillus qinlingensis]
MMTESRFKWLYAAALIIGGTIVWQMVAFLLGHMFHWRPSRNLFDLCLILFHYLHVPGPVPMTLVNGLILYTMGTMGWLAIKHGYDVMKANKLVKKYHDAALSAENAAKFELTPQQLQIVNYKAPLAMTIGLWRPRILVSTGLMDMLEPNELRAVIEHEKCHVQHRDPGAIFLLALISKSMRYIPIFEWIAHKYPMMIELRADKYAIERMEQAADLGSALLKLLKQTTKPRFPLSHASFAETSMNVRIQHILDPQKQVTLRWPLFRLAMSALIFVLVMGLI